MEDMLAKIVEMDEKARELTEKARKRIAKNEMTERNAADEELKKSQRQQKEALEKLEKTYSENCGKWVDSIVSAVINS